MSQQPYGHAPTGPPPSPAQAPATRQAGPRRLGIVAVALAAIALGFAVAAWLRAATAPDASPAYTQQQVADAKKAVCEAFEKTDQMLKANKERRGLDETQRLIAGVNTRLAVFAAGSFLARTLDNNPAAPTGLAQEVDRLAEAFEVIAIDQIAATEPSVLDADYQAAESTSQRVLEMCK
jgi:hypothetical protein